MQKSSNCKIKIFLAICLMALLSLCVGCGGFEPQMPTGKATIQYITKENRMERLTFDDGYLRSTPEMASGTIVANVYKGSQGMLYGKRLINGMYWAKVTTREGVTGWYSPGDKLGEPASRDLNTSSKNYSTTYPVISGISEKAAAKINKDINDYLAAFKYVAGPVGNTLQCRITYNAEDRLSVLFTAGAVISRSYKVADVNNSEFWPTITKYCFIPELHSDVAKENLVAPITDLQYAMVYDLTTGTDYPMMYFLAVKFRLKK